MTVSEGGSFARKQHTLLSSRRARPDAVFGMSVARSPGTERAIALTRPADPRRSGYRFVARTCSARLAGLQCASDASAEGTSIGVPCPLGVCAPDTRAASPSVGVPYHFGVCAPDTVTLRHTPATRLEK